MASRPLNDDEVLSEMNKMVRTPPPSPMEAESHASRCVYAGRCLITLCVAGGVYQARST